jgi:hypothetical protein
MERRDFLKFGAGGLAALVVGSKMPWMDNRAYAAVPALEFTITDTIKEMVTHNAINTAECYFWIYKETNLPADYPAPTILATAGEVINIRIINALEQPHNFVIPGIFNSGIIAAGATVEAAFTVPLNRTGTHLYFDNLNRPVNRVMGLHGAFIVMPAAPVAGQKWTPYRTPTPQVQQLFNDLGSAAHWPGLAWEDASPDTLTPSFRQYVWLLSQASPTLFRDVGRVPAGEIFPAADFVQRFRRDQFSRNSHDLAQTSDIPQYFTGCGQSGHFMHNNPVIVPMARVGEPIVLRVLNAGLMSHSMHIHANHFYIISVDGIVQGDPNPADPMLKGPGPIWVDTFTANPWGAASSKYDLLMPYMRPPDVPNSRGIGRGGSGDAALNSLAGQPVWPPVEEFDVRMFNTIDQRQSPLCYPAHDHSEPSQSAQGGNYNCGVIGGQYFIGDLNISLPRVNINDDPAMPLLPPQTFPMDEDFAMMLGLDQDPQILVYGIDEARRNGIMEASKDSALESQADRPPFPV